MTETVISRQRQTILEAMLATNKSNWPYAVKVQLNEKMSKKLCIEFLAGGFMVFGEGENSYTIKAIAGTNVEEYLEEAKAKM